MTPSVAARHAKAMGVEIGYLNGGMYAAGFSARSANPRNVPYTQSAGKRLTNFQKSLKLAIIQCPRTGSYLLRTEI